VPVFLSQRVFGRMVHRHFWSLSLEEQFYLAWPVLLVALGISRARIAAMVIIASTAIWRVHVFRADPSANIYRPDLLADHLLWGV